MFEKRITDHHEGREEREGENSGVLLRRMIGYPIEEQGYETESGNETQATPISIAISIPMVQSLNQVRGGIFNAAAKAH